MKYVDHHAVGDCLTWPGVVGAIKAGHRLPKAEISDQFLTRGSDTLLSRAAWIDGLGFGVKSVSVMAENHGKGLPTVQGSMLVFEDQQGKVDAVIDSDLVTKWKTAGDSVCGAKILARPNAQRLLIIGAGVVARNLVHAYAAMFPGLIQIDVWNRTKRNAEALAVEMRTKGYPVRAVTDLPAACAGADIISTASMTKTPILHGDWVQPGTHVDLIGAFKSDMREADDALMRKGRLFVDSYDTTLHHIGELMIPIANGVITRQDVLGDYYALVAGDIGRNSDDDITVSKNGGGAHLDLMTAKYILAAMD